MDGRSGTRRRLVSRASLWSGFASTPLSSLHRNSRPYSARGRINRSRSTRSASARGRSGPQVTSRSLRRVRPSHPNPVRLRDERLRGLRPWGRPSRGRWSTSAAGRPPTTLSARAAPAAAGSPAAIRSADTGAPFPGPIARQRPVALWCTPSSTASRMRRLCR